LGRFDSQLNLLNWKVGNFRFGTLQLIDGNICINNYRFHYDLTVLPNKIFQKRVPKGKFYYGFQAKWREQIFFVRMHYSGVFEAVLI
jgi:hypothetical protein